MNIDIRDRKEVKTGVSQQEQPYRAIFSLTSDAIFIFDSHGRIIEANPSACAMHGYSCEEFIGMHGTRLIHPDDHHKFADFVRHVTAGEQYNVEGTHVRKDGGNIEVNVTGSSFVFAGRPALLAVVRDVTEEKRAIDALRENEARFRGAFHQTAVGMAQADLSGRHILVNDRYCRITGYSREELLALTFLDITHPDDLNPNGREFRQLLAGEVQSYEIEKRYIRKDGKVVWVHASTSFIKGAGGNQYLIGVVQDISERKRKQQSLQFLVDLNAAILPLIEPEEIMTVTSRMLGEYLGVDRCAYAEVNPDEERYTIIGHYSRDGSGLIGPSSIYAFGAEALRLMYANMSFVSDDVETDSRLEARDLTAFRQKTIRAAICVPLHKAERLVAGVAVHQKTPRSWLPEEVELVELVAGRCWESIERARAIRVLRENERRQRFIMDSMPQKIFTARPNGEVDYFNRQWMEFCGLAFEQIRDWDWTRFIHPDDVEENVSLWRQSIATGEPFQAEHRFLRADGEYCWHMSRALPIRDDEGRIVMWIGSNTDIHDVKRAEETAVRYSEQVRRLAEVATRINAAHDVTSVIRMVTEEARNLIGSHQSITSFSVDGNWTKAINIVSLSDKYSSWRGYDMKLDGAGIYSRVCRLNKPMRMTQVELEAHPDWKGFGAEAGKHPPMRGWLAAPLVGRDGRNIGLIQLSDKYESEFSEDDEAVLVQMAQMASVAIENARLVEDLRDASRRKDEFLATLAHELRNPLAPLRNMLEVIKQTDGDREGERVHQAHAMMDRQLIHMVRLIDDLLDVSRVSRGKLELRRERVELAAVVSQAAEAGKGLIDCAGHELNITLPPEPVWLYADPVRLIQIFDNLLNNACKYTEPGGRIRVTAECRDGEVTVKVKDTGIGIPSDKLGDIFEMFAQVDHSLERLQGGLGIGLTLVRQLVEMHGGEVTAHSEGPGRGSEFVVRLPLLNEQPQIDKQPPVGKGPPTRRRRILVVDDNRDSAESLAMLLAMAGDETRVAHDGLQAVEAANQFRPDLLLLDLGLPKLNGYDVCRRIRRQPWGKDMMIVAVSGWGQEQDRLRSQEAGFDHHVVKPVDLAALTQLLRS